MSPPPPYSLSELEARSGFDKRTIAYYVSCRLLPPVGRRGPKTTYPPAFLDRLLFIRAVRNLQDEGRMSPVTLAEIGYVLNSLSDNAVRRLLGKKGADAAIRALFEERAGAVASQRPLAMAGRGANRVSDKHNATGVKLGVARPSRRRQLMARRGSAHGLAREATWDASDDVTEDLRALLHEVAISSGSTKPNEKLGATETLTRVQITDDVMITVRNIDKKKAGLVERLATLLRDVAGFKNE